MHLYYGFLHHSGKRGFASEVTWFLSKELVKASGPCRAAISAVLWGPLFCPRIISTEGCAETCFCRVRAPMLWSQLAMIQSGCHITSGDPGLLSSITSFKPGEPQPRFPQQYNGNIHYKPGFQTWLCPQQSTGHLSNKGVKLKDIQGFFTRQNLSMPGIEGFKSPNRNFLFLDL